MIDNAAFQKSVAALCAWREARAEGRDGIRAVLHVIANRAKKRKKSWAEIVFQPLQFSSMTYGKDPQLSLVPKPHDLQMEDCMEAADLIFGGGDFDLTYGADLYYADYIPEPYWAKEAKFLVQIGRHKFLVE